MVSKQHSVLSDVRDALAAPRGDAGVDARMLALDSVQRLVEQLEASRQATQKWYDEAHEQRAAINRALHELDQWVFADGTASYRVERAEEILRGVSSPATKAEAYARQAEAAKRGIESSPGWLRDTAVPPSSPASEPEAS